MKATRLFCIATLSFLVTASTLAKTVNVIVSYGSSGSQGAYACFLYKNGSSWAWKYLTGSGFTTGSVSFPGMDTGTYRARIVCLTNGRETWTNSVSLNWYHTSIDLRAYL